MYNIMLYYVHVGTGLEPIKVEQISSYRTKHKEEEQSKTATISVYTRLQEQKKEDGELCNCFTSTAVTVFAQCNTHTQTCVQNSGTYMTLTHNIIVCIYIYIYNVLVAFGTLQ